MNILSRMHLNDAVSLTPDLLIQQVSSMQIL